MGACLWLPTTQNYGQSYYGASPYGSREYLINGDRLLSQTGGSTIIWLPVA